MWDNPHVRGLGGLWGNSKKDGEFVSWRNGNNGRKQNRKNTKLLWKVEKNQQITIITKNMFYRGLYFWTDLHSKKEILHI